MADSKGLSKTSKRRCQNVSDNEDGSATPLRKSTRATRSRSVTNDNETSPTSEESTAKNFKRDTKVNNEDSDDEANFNLSPLKEELENELKNIEEDTQKASELFLDEEDVSGNKIYGFQTPSKKNAMIQKALLSRTPTTTTTKIDPKITKIACVLTEKINIPPTTPKSSKKKLPKILEASKTPVRSTRSSHPQIHFASDSDESISEDSEFIPTDEDDDDDDDDGDGDIKSEEEKDHSNDDEPDENSSPKRKLLKNQLVPITPCRRGRSRNKIIYNEYHMKTDDYFASQSERAVTSDNTLNRLKNPRLDEDKLKELLINKDHISKEHKDGICELANNCKSHFKMWHYIMEEGYSLLLHGLGSKRNIIHEFHDVMLSDHPTFVVNGFFPSLTIKEILDGIINDVLEIDCPANQNDCFNLIDKTMRDNPDDKLYLLIHNIDGVMLRSNKAQDVLSRLAAIPNIKLIASVDHINAPLLWDNVKKSRYNFYWWDATTFVPYEAETMYESSLLVQQNGALALSSLHNVFASLTKNAKAIYTILVKYQIENGKGNHYSGMAFKDLYLGARENFYVNSDGALRAQLTEFIDHKLVKTKRSADRGEYLIIPISNVILSKFLEDHETT
ncbi:hypothetical protein HCN44_006838 [Aphidius gifuensis]|uniref:Origin recognition complex subunit 2 n=1 Tax=Aphidius gifuensis TaxID=684658 RepID=A0A834Y3A8_APHGI|nr:hypothetical protein HCN44_006838 [Aphidius gifuensis]